MLFFGVNCAFAQIRANSDTSKLVYPLRDSPSIQLKEQTGIDLARPANIERKIEFDPIKRRYIISEKFGNYLYRPVQYLSIEEYQRYENQLLKTKNWKELSDLPLAQAREPGFIQPIVVDNRLFERLFGSKVIDIRPQVSAEVALSGRINENNNPLLQEKQRVQGMFDLNQRIQANVVGQVGTRLRVLINYNTEAQFDFENTVKLQFSGLPTKPGLEGKDDDIIKKIEAGNVSLPLNSSLITGNQALFGVKTQLQFGRLGITALVAQQKSKQQQITIANGSQQNKFQISADSYETNKHYFLSQYFRNNYKSALAKIPTIISNINVTKVEVWVTNKSGSVNTRDILAFLDLGENTPYNTNVITGGAGYAANPVGFLGTGTALQSNNLLNILPAGARQTNDNSISTFFNTDNYMKLERARLLNANEFTINNQLGYISLNASLNSDEVLAVAYQYNMDGVTYQVGEFSTDVASSVDAAPKVLYTKLLKNTDIQTNLPTWNLMMKNIYSLNAFQMDSVGFNLNIYRLDEKSGIGQPQITEGVNTGKLWIQLTNLDNLNQQYAPSPDGAFDFLKGITIDPQYGRIRFPVLEPFGSDLQSRFASTETDLITKYVFQELYTKTQNSAKNDYQKLNRYSIQGTYQSRSSGTEFLLNAVNVPQGSVQVFAGGLPLVDGVDYTVDYSTGRVRILNQAVLSSGQAINIQLENSELFGSQQRTLLASRFDYILNKKVRFGATAMKLRERAIIQNAIIGQEPLNNTIWGVDVNYASNSRWLTRMINKIPLISTKAPSNVTISGEFAQLIPGTPQTVNGYLDDFESNRSIMDLKSFLPWQIAGTPQSFAEYANSGSNGGGDLSYGFNRARLAFYAIDPLFFTASTAPANTADVNALSSHYVRQVTDQEVFPFKQSPTGSPYPLPTLDLAFYPSLRGPYNYTTTGVNTDGTLQNPRQRWGGIFRRIDSNDFDALNVEYIEMWMMDPFREKYATNTGGTLYFNLGNISEDILKDGQKSLEHGLPIDGNPATTPIIETVWGRTPKTDPVVQSFSTDPSARQYQDVGLDGLNDSDEKAKFNDFLNTLSNFLTAEALGKLQADPSSDNYHYFRGADLDAEGADVIARYANYNGTEGNSKTSAQSAALGLENTAATALPDVEDVNRDNNMNTVDRYYEYKLDITPSSIATIGQNNVANIVPATVQLANGQQDVVNWIQFKIPIRKYTSAVNDIPDFKSIRFVRMYLTGFAEPVIMRLAKLQLVRSTWRSYNQENSLAKVIAEPGVGPNPSLDQSTIDVGTVSIDENGQGSSIPYVIPPGINRQLDYNNVQFKTLLNEQSLSLNVQNLRSGYSRAAFKTTTVDMRAYKRMKMFIHAESVVGQTALNDDEIKAFIRIGSDGQNNYYEYELPLKITKPNSSDTYAIWPELNNLDIDLSLFQKAKIERNQLNIAFDQPHYYSDGTNKITVMGQPDMSNITLIMLGVRNPYVAGGSDKNVIVWFDELRLSDPDLRSGWAAVGRLDAQLADLGRLTIAGNKSTAGFGALNNRLGERNRSNDEGFNISSNLELGKFFPTRSGIKLPMYVSYSSKINTPQFDPRMPDIELNNSLETASQAQREAILFRVQDYTTNKSFNFTNIRKIKVGPSSKKHFWDIENFSTSYAYTEYDHHDLLIEKDLRKTYRFDLNYNYANPPKMITPFAKKKLLKAKQLGVIRDINFSLLPASVNFAVNFNRSYAENKLRNNIEGDPFVPLTLYNKNFQILRTYGLTWNATRSILLDFNATNTSVIDEPDGVMINVFEDPIWRKIRGFGRTTNYDHSANITYNVPINKFPGLEWVTLTARYRASFNWRAEALVTAMVDDVNSKFGNTILNTRAMHLNPSLNLNTLYNKFKFIRESKQKKDALSYFIRFITSVKNLNASFVSTEGIVLPGFLPNPNAFFAQDFLVAPGFNFLFGSQSDNIQTNAIANNWITANTQLNTPYTKTRKTEFNLRGTVEPLPDLRIEISATRNFSENYSSNFKSDVNNANNFKNLNAITSGNFNISTITLLTAFDKEHAPTYWSSLFSQFANNRTVLSKRLASQNPNSTGSEDSEGYIDGYGKNSQEVVVASFLAAYKGHDASKVSLNAFPTIPIPNWRLNYGGLMKIDFFKEIFSSFDLNHTYTSVYTVSSYSSQPFYQENNGFSSVKDANGNFLSKYLFPEVRILEQFSPLIGINARLKNNITLNFEYRKNRTLAFNLTNSQLGLQRSDVIVVGIGARTNNFRFPFGLFKQLKLDNDLNFKFDVVINDNKTVIYTVDVAAPQVSSGSKNITIRPSVDYMLDKQFTLRLFYDTNITKPYTSQTFDTAFTNFGVSVKFNLQ